MRTGTSSLCRGGPLCRPGAHEQARRQTPLRPSKLSDRCRGASSLACRLETRLDAWPSASGDGQRAASGNIRQESRQLESPRIWLSLLALFAAVFAPLRAQPTLHTEPRQGVVRAVVLHADTRLPVTDQDPARAAATLIALARGVAADVSVLIGAEEVHGWPRTTRRAPSRSRSHTRQSAAAGKRSLHTANAWDEITFTLPRGTGGSFVELSLLSGNRRSNAATIPVEQPQPDPFQLTAEDVEGLLLRAATAMDDPRMALAVTDRAGRPLGVYRKPEATDDDMEAALSLARTGAFFSHDQAPLSSRTIRTLSRENFPNNVPNQPAAALFGIENTNRGCRLSDFYEPGKSIPAATNLAATGPGKGVTTIPGGLPIFKNRPDGSGQSMVGGIGVAGIDPDAAEFATVAATFGTQFFVALPLPPPQAVFVDGIRLPYVNQTTRPPGTQPAAEPGGEFVVGPRAGAGIADGFLIAPRESDTLTAAEVRQIIDAARERAGRTRAVIRLPAGSRSRMVIAVGDLEGNIIGMFRMPDATVFSIDVAATKARNAVYFSSDERAPEDLPEVPLGTAATARTIGFGSQSFFPSGIARSSAGTFRELFLFDLANPCTQGSQLPNPNQSGIVFFPGSAPLYRNGELVGGLGVSGDGVEQDDYVSAGGAAGFEPPPEIRADRVFVRGVRLPFWRFPRNPEQ